MRKRKSWPMNPLLLLSLVCLLPLVVDAQAPPADDNPFFREWKTPFGVPPFEEIRDEHFPPAFQKGIAERKREVEGIANNLAPATFANTLEALDRLGRLLDRVQLVFSNLTSAETNDR